MLPVMARETDDNVLMVRYRDGDVAAFEELYTRHKGPLYRYFLRHGIEAEPSAEMTQEVWMKIINARERYQSDARFTTYLFRIAHNCLVDQSRRSANRVSRKSVFNDDNVAQLPGTVAEDPEANAMRAESAERFRSALARLPAEQREAFILKQEGGLSLAEVAYVTGVNSETAKSRLRYAFEKLRRQLAGARNNE